MPAPIPTEVRTAILEDIQAGYSARQAARRHGVSQSSVSRIAKQADLPLDRAKTENATRARLVDLAAGRADLANVALEVARAGFTQALAALPDATAAQAATVAGIASDKHLALVKHDADPGTDAARSLLGDLGRALGHAAEHLDQ